MAKIKRSAKNLESSDNVKQKNTVKQARKTKSKTTEAKNKSTKTKKSENSPILENNERKLRSCVVKLRRTHETPINTQTTKNKQLAANKTKQPGKGALQGDVEIVKEKSLIDNCNNELRQPATPSIRACIVRVQRTPNQNPSTPFIVPTIDEQKRRRLSKLSLTKKTRQLVQSLAEADNDEISLFEPARNSTLHAEALKLTTNEANEQKDEDARRTHDVNRNSLSKHDNSSKNLTNRSDLIEEILLSVENDDDDDAALPNNNNNNQKSHAVPPSDNNKTQKFFHRTNNATTNDAPPPTAPTTSRSAKSIDTIYEFLSQSQTSDSDIGKPKDPTADIVKKLIEEGRVLVAAPVKGCGKSRVKSRGVRKAKDKVAKVKKPAARRGRKLKKKEEIEKIIELSENESDHDDQHHGDHGDNDIDDELPMQPSSPIEEIESNEQIVQEAPVASDSRHHGEQHAEGTFSNLARSVLMQQTERNRVNQRQRLLLEQARKIISTPVQRKATQRAAASATMTPPQAAASALHLSNLSPIHYLSNARINPNSTSKPQPQQSPLGNSSPWRASDESRHLPSVFHFSRGSSNLPSFSSDYIPATPQKPKRYVNKYASLGENTINDDAEDNDGNNGNKDLPAAVGGSSSSNIISSFSSNDSNAENMPPPKKSMMHDKPSTSAAAARLAQSAIATAADENENIFNSRQMPNPRRTLAHRSPLKAINIQEVVMLPSWKPNQPSKPATNAEKPATDSHNVSIFGFDEYLDADSSFAAEPEKQQQQNVSSNNETIRSKLKELRKYRPKTKEVRINHQPKLSRDAAKVFDEPGGKPTQRHIKEMLCSTMIHGTKPSLDMPNNANSSGNAIDHLFNDVELSFNEENPHRTYVAPVKRKRKLRNQFAMFLDSDCSEDDESGGSGDDFVDGNKKKTSDKHAVQKKKKQRKEATATAAKKHENQEFKEFLNSFNEMCKEVEEYQLIVEKSA